MPVGVAAKPTRVAGGLAQDEAGAAPRGAEAPRDAAEPTSGAVEPLRLTVVQAVVVVGQFLGRKSLVETGIRPSVSSRRSRQRARHVSRAAIVRIRPSAGSGTRVAPGSTMSERAGSWKRAVTAAAVVSAALVALQTTSADAAPHASPSEVAPLDNTITIPRSAPSSALATRTPTAAVATRAPRSAGEAIAARTRAGRLPTAGPLRAARARTAAG